MSDNKYYHPDYHQLNKKAELRPKNNNSELKDKLIGRLLPGNPADRLKSYDPVLAGKLDATLTAIKNDINWEQKLPKASYLVFDTETTGLHPFTGDEIISIGAVVIEKGRINNDKTFYQLVNPNRSISSFSRKITGINEEMLTAQPTIGPVIADFLQFAGPRIMVAHNAPFDLAFLNIKLSEITGRRIVNPVIDTVLLAKAIYPSYGDYSLENLAPRFGIDLSGRHHALADAHIAAALFLHLLTKLSEIDIINLPQLAGLFSELDQRQRYPLIF